MMKLRMETPPATAKPEKIIAPERWAESDWRGSQKPVMVQKPKED